MDLPAKERFKNVSEFGPFDLVEHNLTLCRLQDFSRMSVVVTLVIVSLLSGDGAWLDT
jgi:hypothetical protein